MTRPLVALALTVCLVPASAFAQSGATLGDPLTGRMPDSTGSQPIPFEMPEERAVEGVDPEIAAMRNEGQAPQSSYAHGWSVVERPQEPGVIAPREPPSFGATWGHAFAGFGIGAGGGYTLGAMVGCAFDCFFGAMLIAPFGAAALAPIGAALGAWGWGEQAGGTGNFFASLGLSMLGASVGVGTAWLVTDSTQTAWGILVGPLVGMVLSTLGAAVGYQISSHGPADPGTIERPTDDWLDGTNDNVYISSPSGDRMTT